MTDLQVVPLHHIDPLPDVGIDACLVGKVTERSVVHLNNYGVRAPTVVFPLD